MAFRYFQAILTILLGFSAWKSEAGAQCQPACQSGYKCVLNNCVIDVQCPKAQSYGQGPPATCTPPSDPLSKPPSKIESWFTQEIFNDLFPKANLGWGPNKCFPYSYEAFIIAARYFPEFGTEAPQNGFTADENNRRDLAAFFSHAIQETGENDASLYSGAFQGNQEKADACFYRGGFYNWFEGGPVSSFLPKETPGYDPKDGATCTDQGLYCSYAGEWHKVHYPCNTAKNGSYNAGCYFGRGAIQLSYNFNYGQFQMWLKEQGLEFDLLKEPNLLMTMTNPPLSIMASMWFYMTPQPPKPAMHDIVMGNWKPRKEDEANGYKGAIFGPTSLIINNECNGEDGMPGGGGENRRIKAFKWFSKYFGYRLENDKFLTCKGTAMLAKGFSDNWVVAPSYNIDWQNSWKESSCNCVPAGYEGGIFYYAPGGYFPDRFVAKNEAQRQRCVRDLYENPASMQAIGQNCLRFPPAGIPVAAPQPATPPPQGQGQCTGAGQQYPDPDSCENYFVCDGALQPQKRTCQPGLRYSVSAQTCDWAANVKCDSEGGQGGQSGTGQCKSAGQQYPDPGCQTYNMCDGGLQPQKRTCQPGLLFSESAQVCDWAANVKCSV